METIMDMSSGLPSTTIELPRLEVPDGRAYIVAVIKNKWWAILMVVLAIAGFAIALSAANERGSSRTYAALFMIMFPAGAITIMVEYRVLAGELYQRWYKAHVEPLVRPIEKQITKSPCVVRRIIATEHGWHIEYSPIEFLPHDSIVALDLPEGLVTFIRKTNTPRGASDEDSIVLKFVTAGSTIPSYEGNRTKLRDKIRSGGLEHVTVSARRPVEVTFTSPEALYAVMV